MNRLLARFEPTFRLLDRVAGGRLAGLAAPPDGVAHPRTRRVFVRVAWLLLMELALGLAAVAVAVRLALSGESVTFVVWMRTLVVLGITATLFYFTWRASLGWYWAYQRLVLFSRIFPIVTLGLAAVPHLYPAWMIAEQLVFSSILLGIGFYLTSPQLREVFPRPARVARAARKPRDER